MERAEANNQATRDHDTQMKQMDAELKMALDKQADDAKNMMAQLEQAKLNWEMQKFGMQQEFEKQKLNIEDGTDNKKIDVEKEVEMSFLDEQKRTANMDFMMKKADLAIKGAESTQESLVKQGQTKEKVKDT